MYNVHLMYLKIVEHNVTTYIYQLHNFGLCISQHLISMVYDTDIVGEQIHPVKASLYKRI